MAYMPSVITALPNKIEIINVDEETPLKRVDIPTSAIIDPINIVITPPICVFTNSSSSRTTSSGIRENNLY
ncbi:hypothetical protein SAMN05661091_2781 [Paenibacillus uliginis N3/975]|uniref:Uncharacterized protein n=1 Tax=Paenibacillus uliginis N3/975 TaxID=1313296 RepID=A0A1X7HEC0_9BACL|nr:hypothetical protein SAMN05661091_2781 [Paenibacillus uliginis N3/975]